MCDVTSARQGDAREFKQISEGQTEESPAISACEQALCPGEGRPGTCTHLFEVLGMVSTTGAIPSDLNHPEPPNSPRDFLQVDPQIKMLPLS